MTKNDEIKNDKDMYRLKKVSLQMTQRVVGYGKKKSEKHLKSHIYMGVQHPY